MGGFVGMRLAARRPDLVRSLVLLDTAADAEPAANVPKYRRLNLVARWMGVSSWLAEQVLPIMCGSTFLTDPRREGERRALARALRANAPSVYKAVNGVIRRQDCLDAIGSIRCPTSVLWGTEDRAIARERAEQLVAAIPDAVWVELADAGHTSTLEQPEAVTRALREHLDRAGATGGRTGGAG